jgi:pimeloyl-ACP methyl ester carboxylesterase
MYNMLRPKSLILFASSIHAQLQPIHIQNNTYNSNFALSPTQIQAANLSATLANNVEIALNFERTNWATGSVASDPFYAAPATNASTPPGTLLAVEDITNTSLYTLAPGLALSRILFVSMTFNGTAVPASAYILWPWHAKLFASSPLAITGVPVIGWAHGTSGIQGECAPSHIRNLWYQHSAPFTLALNGYAVVAPDFAGLGVNSTAEGKSIPHEYAVHKAGANDVLYAVRAAQSAFPKLLSKHFVTVGHSQGGGVTWGLAEKKDVADHHLGAVSVSPLTDMAAQVAANPNSAALLAYLAQSFKSVLANFTLADVFTPQGVQLLRLAEELGACNSVVFQVFRNPAQWLKADWKAEYLDAFAKLVSVGGHAVSVPMLVLQGTADPTVNYEVTAAAVEHTCTAYPNSQIEFVAVEGATHGTIMYAGQQIWLEWIADRFNSVEVGKGCTKRVVKSVRPVGSYQKELKYYLQLAVESYTVA